MHAAPVVAEGHDHHRRGPSRELLAEEQDERQRLRARLRRADRQAILDLPHHPAPRRVRRRDVGRQGVAGVHRQYGRVGADQRRRGARPRLPAGRAADRRLLWRASAGQRAVRREPGRRRSENRQAEVALPARASRHLGLGHSLRADPARPHDERQGRQGGRAADQAVVGLPVRPGHRAAALADRGAPGAAIRRAAREDQPDAAVPDEAAGVRSAGRVDRRSDRLHAGAAGRGVEARVALQAGADLYAADRRASGTGRSARS